MNKDLSFYNLRTLPGHHFSYIFLLTCSYLIFPGITFGQSLDRYDYSQMHMGTDFRILLYASDSLVAQSASDAAYERIKELDHILSDYKEDSELNRLSGLSGTGQAVAVSDDLFFVIKKAVEFSKITHGAFDITMGPYVRLWRIARRSQRFPSEDNLKQAHDIVGYEHIELDQENKTVKLNTKGMKLDLGGIGKGFAVDEVLTVLREHNISHALIDAGGDIIAGDAPPGKEGWPITMSVVQDGEIVNRTLMIQNKAVATSGDVFQYIQFGETRYSHVIDPQTGLGLTDQSQVTVTAPDCVTADSFATAINILGPDKGRDLIRHGPEIDFYFFRKKDDKYEKWKSKLFTKVLNN